MPQGIVTGVDAHLQLQGLGIHDIELGIPAEVQRQQRQRQHVGPGRELQQGFVVQVDGAEGEVLAEGGGNHAHGRGVLPGHAQGIVVNVSGQEGISGGGPQLPMGDIQLGFYAGGGHLGEVVLPLVVVGIEVLLVKVRLFQPRLKFGRQGDGAVRLPPERIEIHLGIGLNKEVAHFGSGKVEQAGGVPLEISAHEALCSGIGVEAVPLVVGRLVQGLVGRLEVESLEAVAHAAFHLGYNGVFLPGLQAHVDAVLQTHVPQGVRALVRIDVEAVVEKEALALVRLVHIPPAVGAELRGAADEAGGDIGVQGVGLHPGRVFAVPQLFDEVEGNPEALVIVGRKLLVAVRCRCQVHVYLPHVHQGVPNPGAVLHAAAFRTVSVVVDEAAVGQVTLAQVVAGHKVVAVVRMLVLEDAGAAVTLHLRRHVKGGGNVLRGENAEVVGR